MTIIMGFCYMISIMEFASWLADNMKKAGFNQSQLAKRSNLNQAAISRLLNGQATPSPETCQSFARVLHIPVEIVYRAAGLLPPKAESNQVIDEIIYLAGQLPPDDLQDLLDLARGKINRYERAARPAEKT